MTDMVQNAVEADATEIKLDFHETAEWIEFEVRDNGKGMNSETQAKAADPFYSDGEKHAHRRVGLGLPFLLQTAEAAGGTASIDSQQGKGTIIRFRAQAQHVDLPPLGDFAGTAVMMLTLLQNGEMKIVRSLNGNAYTLSRCELEDAIGDLNSAGSLKLLRDYVHSQETHLRKAG
jgi:hypothetical protein